MRPRPSPRSIVVPGLLLTALAACGNGPGEVEGPVEVEQPVADTLVGLDMARVDQLTEKIRRGLYGEVHSLLIQRYDSLVVEEYFGSGSATGLHTLQSVTKSVTSALVGIAIGQGAIESVDERVLDFFPQWDSDLGTNALRATMRLEDVLTMQTGTDYHESGPDSPHAQLNALDVGWDWFWLNRPMEHSPGTFWRYDSGGVVTLSSMLRARTGMHADAYGDSVLLRPLGITNRRWATNMEGHPHTGGGLFLTSRDMLRFGQLYLNRGRSNGEQLVPEAWVDASFQRRHVFPSPRGSAGKTEAYGYLWWVLAPDPAGSGEQDIYSASGYRGQYIFVIPEHGMLVVVTGWIDPSRQGGPIEFLYSDILPAIVS